MLDYFPNADHAGLYAAQAAGLYEKAGPRRQDPGAAGPVRAAEAAARRPRRRGDLLRARAAARARPGAENLVARRRARAGAADVADGASRRRASRPRGPRGQARRHVRHPVPERVPEDDPGEGGRGPGSVKETNVGFNLVPAMLSKKVDATLGAFWNYEGVDLQRRKRKPVILRMEKLGVPTYNELILVARRESLDEAGASRLRRFITATAAGHRLLRDDPAAGVDALLEADKGLDRGLQEAAVKATLPVFFPAGRREALGLAGAGRLGQLRALDARERAAQAAAFRGAAADQRVPAGRGPGSVRRADEMRGRRGRPTARRARRTRAPRPRRRPPSGCPVVRRPTSFR